MRLDVQHTRLPGCFELTLPRFDDPRGWFLKLFHEDAFREADLRTDFREQYVSLSNRNVLRGLHFQVPPVAHAKVVLCLDGEVFDVAVDLRRGSPTYGQWASFTLSAERANAVYLPEGFAHGFLTTSDRATMLYMVTSVYSPEHDRGVLWSSAGIDWPATDGPVLLSDRDRSFPALSDFDSPFEHR